MWIIVSEDLMINTSTAKEIRRLPPGRIYIGNYEVFNGTDADAVFLEILTAIFEGKRVFNLLNRTKGGEKP